MRRSVFSSAVAAAMLLAMVGACSSGPPSISEVTMGKTKEAAEPTNSFGARDTLYGVARIANPPSDGKVVGRLVIVDVQGQQAGPIPGLETTLNLTGGMNVATLTFSPPTNGWPDGKYQLETVLLDGTGAEKDRKTADFTTTGNAAAAEAPAAEGEPTATAEEGQTEGGDDTTT